MKIQINVPTYRTIANIYIHKNKDKLINRQNKTLSYFGEQEDNFNVRGRSYDIYINKEGYRSANIILDKNQLSPGLIAHEIMHTVFYILRYVGIPHTEETEEAYTCLNEYLIESVHRELY